MCRDFGDCLGWIGLVEIAIDVIEEVALANTKRSNRATQLGFADRAERGQPRVVLLGTLPAALATRRGYEVYFDSFGGILGQRAAVAQRLVVGVGQHAHQS